VADFVAAVGNDQMKAPATQIAALLGSSGGTDHFRVTAKPIPSGMTLRLDAEEGLLKVLSAVSPPAREFLKLK
jgi:hypothetical protein